MIDAQSSLREKLKRTYAAVLFDFDGVLGRTMEDNYAAWADALAAHGIPLKAEEYYLLEGATTSQVAETVLRKHERDLLQVPAIISHKEQYYAAHHSFAFYEGATDLVDRLRNAGMKLGLVSGAARARLTATCGEAFLALFDAVITGEDVLHGKPSPDPYLCAARKLALSATQCLVLENAPLGIRAAKSAGMDCVAIASTLDERFLVEADVVISRLDEFAAMETLLHSIA